MTTEPTATPKRRKRVFLWVYLALQVVFVLWIVSAIASTHNPTCQGLTQADCQSVADAGSTIAVYIIAVFWAVVDIIVGGGYAVYRLARRPKG